MIYLDNASTTKTDSEALKIYNKYSEELYYNPSSSHKGGFKNSQELTNARQIIKNLLCIKDSDKLLFCSGATEANNTIIRSNVKAGCKLLTSVGEHPSVLNVFKELSYQGVEVYYVGLKQDGTINLEELTEIVQNNKIDFVSIMNVSNETGAINDIFSISKICKTANPNCLIHSDGVQAVGKIPVSIRGLGVDYYTFSGHKFGAPKGIGAFYVSSNAKLKPLVYGGGQEFNFRSGTENLPAIVAMAKALQISIDSLKKNFSLVESFKDYIIKELVSEKYIKINSTSYGSPYILSLSIPRLKGEVLVHFLEQDDILIGTGSACSSKKIGNNTLQAMGLTKEDIVGSIRLSFSSNNTFDEVKFVSEKLKSLIIKQREMI